ncbi:hypothetical protein [Tengunoibacter tsumagoiensis]|uniref:Yip1 domain-containing protein n=1 Tax=Tengunoibacter tsumagoiensis TaxID=2014871 RepID=A0A402A4G8_9CHLR|nr:hypothetical protein [Tengunoibacter tsumagoiensis]GCE13895.1 hypothetical protein KTT_37540 [Tengunoibacter tsumagoiensis]
MYTIDTTTLGNFIQTLWLFIRGAWRLDPTAFAVLAQTHGSFWLVIWIPFLGAISVGLGQSVALLVNRVQPIRFVASLCLSGALYVISVSLWIATIWLFGSLILQHPLAFLPILRAVCLAYAPYCFGFLILLPYMGSLIEHVLDIWCLLAVILAIHITLQLDFWLSLLCTVCGWLLFVVLKVTIGRPVQSVTRWLRRITAGVPLTLHVRDLASSLTEEMQPPQGGHR